MFSFKFIYTDGTSYEIENIDKISIDGYSSINDVTGDAILSVRLPLKTMYLYNANETYTVSGVNLRAIRVQKQES